MNTCDDCGKDYPGDPYYTYDGEVCSITETDALTGTQTEIPHDCTENICPECAGPYMEPDEPEDPRRPHLDIDDILDLLNKPWNAEFLTNWPHAAR